MDKVDAINDAKIKISSIEWLVPHYAPSLDQQSIIMKQIKNRVPTELHYIERSVIMHEVKSQKVWQFQIGTQESKNIPIFIKIGFQQEDRENSQNLKKDTFCILTVTSAQCIIGSEKYPDGTILLNYADDDYSQGYGQIKEAFRTWTKGVVFKPYTSEHDFRSSNEGNNIGYSLYVFDIQYQKNFEFAQLIKIKFKFG